MLAKHLINCRVWLLFFRVGHVIFHTDNERNNRNPPYPILLLKDRAGAYSMGQAHTAQRTQKRNPQKQKEHLCYAR